MRRAIRTLFMILVGWSLWMAIGATGCTFFGTHDGALETFGVLPTPFSPLVTPAVPIPISPLGGFLF
ncbi:MAG: hypothetical protein FWC56_04035 [Phycisphaerae bacterium]|nr:hypothetical protein [Phycisphaerae bacterium]